MRGEQIIIYQVAGNEAAIDVQITDETVWLYQRQMA